MQDLKKEVGPFSQVIPADHFLRGMADPVKAVIERYMDCGNPQRGLPQSRYFSTTSLS
jgi:hypothetical protein